jgi:sorbitol-specific phosphotransferase system component IIBC
MAAEIRRSGGHAAVDPFVIVIGIALLATVGALLIGLLVMSGGGNTDAHASTPLMWARVGLQALTILLLFVALVIRR